MVLREIGTFIDKKKKKRKEGLGFALNATFWHKSRFLAARMFAIKITVQSINFRRELATIVRVLVIVTTVIRNVLLLIIHRIISISISFIRPYLNRISTSYASNTKLVVNATPELWQYQYPGWHNLWGYRWTYEILKSYRWARNHKFSRQKCRNWAFSRQKWGFYW